MMPPCCYALESEPLAKRLYAAYNRGGPENTRGLNYQGLPCPTWEELPAAVREKWENVAHFVTDFPGGVRG